MSIGFVIVTYESERVLPLCLKSLPKSDDVIVVDNGSKDRSVEIARSFGVRVIVNEKNLGFGTACNQGAKLLSTSHVFFLNPDAVLDGSTVPELEKAIAQHPDAGGWGPAIRVAARGKSSGAPHFRKTRERDMRTKARPSRLPRSIFSTVRHSLSVSMCSVKLADSMRTSFCITKMTIFASGLDRKTRS